jgi:hypothetical protein
VKKRKDAVHLAVYGTPRRQARPATQLVLVERARSEKKRKTDPHCNVRNSHAKKVSKAQRKLDKRRTATYRHTRAEIEEAWLGLWERQIGRFDWQVSIKQTKIMHIPTAEQRKAVDAWVANGRRETPTVDVPGWDELCRPIGSEAVTPAT